MNAVLSLPLPACPAEPPPRALLEAELGRILRSRCFHQSRRHQRLLRHLVERAAEGETAALKESVLAAEVFGRAADRFDPSRDTIVRVELRRLRQRLQRYYEDEGADAACEIELRPGCYVPGLRRRDGGGAPEAALLQLQSLLRQTLERLPAALDAPGRAAARAAAMAVLTALA